MRRMKMMSLALMSLLVIGIAPGAEAARYPDPELNGIEWFYVFGQQGNPYYGAETEAKIFVVQVPAQTSGSIIITILDAEARGTADEMAEQVWNTSTKFSVYAGSKLLQSETVTPEQADGTRLELGPFSVNDGAREGGWSAFRVEVQGLEGNDNNLFAFEIQPEQAQFIALNPSIRLAPRAGDQMFLYPSVPAGTSLVTAWNYDFDQAAGRLQLIPGSPGAWQTGVQKAYRLRNSGSAQWSKTRLKIEPDFAGMRWTYRITKGDQSRANMSVRLENQDGQMLPIFFTPGDARPVRAPKRVAAPQAPEPVLACNTFDFDASKSYDADNDQLTFLWDFGDGATSTATRTRHTYQQAGAYQVVLTATDNSTAECRQSQNTQALLVNMPPQAQVEGPAQACAGSAAQFSAAKSSDTPGDQLTYHWDFGDGSTADGVEVSHAFARGGNFPVKLTLNDNQGTVCSRAVATTSIAINSAPIARANDAMVMCVRDPQDPFKVTLNASGSKDPDGDKLTYRWDFGDGATADGERVTHQYQRGGNFTARVVVDDGLGTACSVARASVPIRLNRAPIVMARQDVTACAGSPVTFDASASSDPDGDALTFRWDFGDGETAQGPRATHRYAKGGEYRVTLTANDGSDLNCAASSRAVTARINSAPRAIARAAALSCVGQTVAFDASDSSDPERQRLTFSWDFGDGATAEGVKVDHAYAAGGMYPISLTVNDEQGTACSTAMTTAHVRVNTPPLADAGPNVVCCREDVNMFDASKSADPDGDALTYRWDFGDGAQGTGPVAEHAYAKNGQFSVRVTVDDKSGSRCATATSGFTASVNAAPVAQMAIRGVEGIVVPATAGE